MNKIIDRFKSINSLHFLNHLGRLISTRNPLSFLNSDINVILRSCTFNESFLSDFEFKFTDHILNQKRFNRSQINDQFNKELYSREDYVDTKNFLILLKTADEKFNFKNNNSTNNKNFIYNYIKAYFVKENFCEDIIHFLDCHPTNINFNLFFKFFQINNQISIMDYENHEYYKKLINKNLDKFDFFNLINLRQMLILNKRMLSRFYLNYSDTNINLKYVNSIYLEKLLSNKYNVSKSLKEGIDLVNFLFEMIKNDKKNEKFWKIAKRIYIKFSHENRLNIFEQIFSLCVFSLNSKGNKNFYLDQLNLIKKNIIRENILIELNKAETKNENLELLLDAMINLIFNIRIVHNIQIESDSVFRKIFKKYITNLKENLIHQNKNFMNRINALYQELLFILNGSSMVEDKNCSSSLYYAYYKLIKFNNTTLNPSKEEITKSLNNLKYLYDKLIHSKNSSLIKILPEKYLINFNFNLLHELVKLRNQHPSAIDNKFIVHVISNLIKQFIILKEEFLFCDKKKLKTEIEDKANFKLLEKLKIFLIRLHNILKPNNYFNETELKQNFLNEAKKIIISNLNNERHLQHLNKIHKELTEDDKQYTETLKDWKNWESYNKVINY